MIVFEFKGLIWLAPCPPVPLCLFPTAAGIGAMVDTLQQTKLWDTALLVAHTDNGGELPYAHGGEPGVPDENGGAGNNFPLRTAARIPSWFP